MNKLFNVLIIGSGPAGLFAAMWLENMGVDNIAIIDKSQYPAGGLLNDGKLNFNSYIGVDCSQLHIDRKRADGLVDEVRNVFIQFPLCKQVTFIEANKDINILQKIAHEHDVKLIAPEQWHWGTDNGKAVVDFLRKKLLNTDFLLKTEVLSIERDNDRWTLICKKDNKSKNISGKTVLAAPGRSGSYWFRDVSNDIGISSLFGPIDVGIRLELNRNLYDSVTDIIYDPKFIFKTKRHEDKVRTFCTNPGGRVRVENYGIFKLVNGDALSRRKTENTNFALINTVALTKPFSDTTEFGQMIAKQFYLLGGGKPIVQRVGDFREGRRSSSQTFNSSIKHFDFCKASYNAVPGDISLGLPARIMDNLWETLKTLDKIVPGVLHPSTLLYAPEIKFFDTIFPTEESMETNVKGVFVAGDGTGKSRGIVGAAISGILAAQGIFKKYF